jgi:hypothetical protein
MYSTRDQTVHFSYVTILRVEGKSLPVPCKPTTAGLGNEEMNCEVLPQGQGVPIGHPSVPFTAPLLTAVL